MTDSEVPGGEVRYRVLKVFCRRLERQLSVDEHERCLYCTGDRAAIETTRHQAFCDFKPGQDPIHFGFPDDAGRWGR